MLGQGGLDLDRRDPHALDLEGIGLASGEPEEAFFVEIEVVAGADPRADEGLTRFLELAPIEEARGIALHPGLADHVRLRDVVSVRTDEADLVAEHGLAEAAAFGLFGPVRDPFVGNLGTADRIQDVQSERSVKPLEDLGWNFLRRAHHHLDRVEIRR